MRDNLWLGDLYMKQRQGDALKEREQTRLAHKAAGHQRFRHRVAAAFGRFRHRLEAQVRRARERPSLESTPSARRRDALG